MKKLEKMLVRGHEASHWLKPTATMEDVADWVLNLKEKGTAMVLAGNPKTAIDGGMMAEKFLVPAMWGKESKDFMRGLYSVLFSNEAPEGVKWFFHEEKNRIYIVKA